MRVFLFRIAESVLILKPSSVFFRAAKLRALSQSMNRMLLHFKRISKHFGSIPGGLVLEEEQWS
jgi:hypothetical protein